MFKFFEFYPVIKYQHTSTDDNLIQMTNILKRVKIKDNISDNVAFFNKYYIKDGESPEIIADKLYGDPGLHWIILFINNIVNPFYDWPLSIDDLQRFTANQYGSGQEGAIHHWEDINGLEVLSTEPGASAVSNLQHEEAENEKKRLIKLLKSEFVSNFIEEFKNKIK